MNLSDMISKMNPEMLSHGLKKVSSMLTPEQVSQMEQAIKTMNKEGVDSKLQGFSADDLKKELSSNPDLAKNLAKNPELMKKLTEIFNSGKK